MTSPSQPPSPAQPLARPVRWFFLALSLTSLALGVIGAFLPVLPTVPFILLAAWAATKGSPRLSHWMETHPKMGPMIMDWRNGGVVSRKAKWLATVMMSCGAVTMSFIVRPWWIPAGVIGIMFAVAVWLWQRPEAPPG
jgi:uncharacterized membrane protein YbaN (DUF454 family)